ncbi:MAG: LysM peptidoglycan-binding domain-containing protein [Anaerolineales bacterium]|nr:LysM peptidoglycan-binding domain-containing protein [Anaerolineales bacterium]
MNEVTCFHCGNRVQISPDAERCSVCGANLRKLIGREQASGYFYSRAADMSGAGNVLAALQEVQRGLAYVPSSELNLLGAILCKRLGRLEDMRHFVAAIPVDDALRGEGEWLLRSNQARQRVPANAKARGNTESLPIVTDDEVLPLVADEVAPSRHHPKPVRGKSWPQAVMWLVLLGALLVGSWVVWQNPPADMAALLPFLQPALAAESESVPMTTRMGEDTASAKVEGPADAPVDPQVVIEPTPSAEPTREPIFPSLTPPANVAALTEEPQITTIDLQSVAIAAEASPFDFKALLRELGRDDLAALPVTARVEGGRLVLEGTVEWAEQRDALEFAGRQGPGIDGVTIANVRVKPPATYVVQEGDSLWGISVRIYGNPDQVEELFAANTDILPSANALSVGMELKVPPIE